MSTDRRAAEHGVELGVEGRVEHRVEPRVARGVGARRAQPWWQVLVEPTIPVIALAEIAHVARRNVTDIVVFAGIAVVVVIDRLRPLSSSGSDPVMTATRRQDWPPATVLAVSAGYGLLVVPLARTGPSLPAVLAVPGVVALAAVWRHRPPTHDALHVPKPARRWVLWPLAILVALLFELANFLSQPDAQTSNPDHPVLSDVVEPLLSSSIVRGVVCMVWLVIGIWLVRRIRSVNEGAYEP